MKTLAKLVLLLITAAATGGCANRLPDLRTYQDPRSTKEYQDLLASGANIDFDECPGIVFKSGHPKNTAEKLFQSLGREARVHFKRQFFDCLGLYSKTPEPGIEINGFSDPAECVDDCEALSLRRAAVVREALLEMHFPEKQISCVAGHGAGYSLDGKNSARNRRVEIWRGGAGCKLKSHAR